MMNSPEIRHSQSLIDKAEARVAYQQAAIRRLGLDVDPRFAAIADDTLARMEARLSRLRASHADLLNRQPRVASARDADEARSSP